MIDRDLQDGVSGAFDRALEIAMSSLEKFGFDCVMNTDTSFHGFLCCADMDARDIEKFAETFGVNRDFLHGMKENEGVLSVEGGYGIIQERESSAPLGIGIRMRMYDDDAVRFVPYELEDGLVRLLRPLGNGYVLDQGCDTCESRPEDVDHDDALSACSFFLKSAFRGMRVHERLEKRPRKAANAAKLGNPA